MDALELLQQDHENVMELFEQAETTEGTEQEAIFDKIKTELEMHTHIEESVFYPAMQKYDELKDMVRESLEEHQKVKTLLKEMENSSDVGEFESKLEELIENVQHHAEEEEEGKMFPRIRQLVSSQELNKLGDQLQAAKGQRKAS